MILSLWQMPAPEPYQHASHGRTEEVISSADAGDSTRRGNMSEYDLIRSTQEADMGSYISAHQSTVSSLLRNPLNIHQVTWCSKSGFGHHSLGWVYLSYQEEQTGTRHLIVEVNLICRAFDLDTSLMVARSYSKATKRSATVA